MDQEKIGKFIASCRKEQGLTQAVLAERLGITDRAVSKWLMRASSKKRQTIAYIKLQLPKPCRNLNSIQL